MSTLVDKDSDDLLQKFLPEEESLLKRRKFIHLGEKESLLLLSLIDWAKQNVSLICKEHVEWLFQDNSIVSYFERQSRKEQISLTEYRLRLESQKETYICDVFEWAEDHWGTAYYEKRFYLGRDYLQTGFRSEWFIGSYVQLQRVIDELLYKGFSKNKAYEYSWAIHKVLNYDMQAIMDAYRLGVVCSFGLSSSDLQSFYEEGKREDVEVVNRIVSSLLEQSQALEEGEICAKCLTSPVNGVVGKAFHSIGSILIELVKKFMKFSSSLSETSKGLLLSNQQLNESINEIAESTTKATTLIRNSLNEAKQAKQIVVELESYAKKIDTVVNTITSIADQTKVLALNATIEAARAGEAGKGFNVVAKEVKDLANNTAKATKEIEGQIRAIQRGTKDTVGAILSITEKFEEINEMSNTIAVAAEEQTVVTNSSMEASGVLEGLSDNLKDVVEKYQK